VTTDARATFYYRDGCHLCEEMAAFLFRHWPQLAAGLRWVDVDGDPQLAQRYGLDVPVLTVGGQVVCRHAPDTAALQRCFGPPVIPV
jgi:hypothetical protein